MGRFQAGGQRQEELDREESGMSLVSGATVLEAGEGKTLTALGTTYSFKAVGSDTNGTSSTGKRGLAA